jgi:hypothetical protein
MLCIFGCVASSCYVGKKRGCEGWGVALRENACLACTQSSLQDRDERERERL